MTNEEFRAENKRLTDEDFRRGFLIPLCILAVVAIAIIPLTWWLGNLRGGMLP